jgi:RNA polymerase sigma-70 factor, ECF subfamily
LTADSAKKKLFYRILDENGSRLKFFARAHTRGDNWQDLEQEIMAGIWEGLDRYEGRADIKTWVYAIAVNTLKNFNRMLNRPEIAVESLELLPAHRQSTYSTGKNMDAIHILDAFIRVLGDADRTAFLMHSDGCTYQEISVATGLDEGVLRVRIHRLKKQLAKFAEG